MKTIWRHLYAILSAAMIVGGAVEYGSHRDWRFYVSAALVYAVLSLSETIAGAIRRKE